MHIEVNKHCFDMQPIFKNELFQKRDNEQNFSNGEETN